MGAGRSAAPRSVLATSRLGSTQRARTSGTGPAFSPAAAPRGGRVARLAVARPTPRPRAPLLVETPRPGDDAERRAKRCAGVKRPARLLLAEASRSAASRSGTSPTTASPAHPTANRRSPPTPCSAGSPAPGSLFSLDSIACCTCLTNRSGSYRATDVPRSGAATGQVDCGRRRGGAPLCGPSTTRWRSRPPGGATPRARASPWGCAGPAPGRGPCPGRRRRATGRPRARAGLRLRRVLHRRGDRVVRFPVRGSVTTAA